VIKILLDGLFSKLSDVKLGLLVFWTLLMKISMLIAI
jgi:hypothetical protein